METLQIQNSKNLNAIKKMKIDEEEEFIKKYSSMCKRCNRNFLLEYEYEFVCYICGYIVIKQKNQLTKIQKKEKY